MLRTSTAKHTHIYAHAYVCFSVRLLLSHLPFFRLIYPTHINNWPHVKMLKLHRQVLFYRTSSSHSSCIMGRGFVSLVVELFLFVVNVGYTILRMYFPRLFYYTLAYILSSASIALVCVLLSNACSTSRILIVNGLRSRS